MIYWTCQSFSELSKDLLYSIIQLRLEVFSVEQDCVYQDLDGVDQYSFHLCGFIDDQLVAYARLVEPGHKYEEPSIGRVATKQSQRKAGFGKQLMTEALRQCEIKFPNQGIRMSAQYYLEKFYSGFGFNTESKPYMEDGIPHIEMYRPPGN